LEDESIVRALRAGAVGYLLKDTSLPDLLQAIKAAVAGQAQISPKAAARLVQNVVAPERSEMLSRREAEVLQLLARGSANKQIGHDLGIAEKTVKTHVSSILAKLGVQSRTLAALYAVRVGLVPLDQLGEADTTGIPEHAERVGDDHGWRDAAPPRHARPHQRADDARHAAGHEQRRDLRRRELL
jgi:DNA-binding CsgD family transcriptional regulator